MGMKKKITIIGAGGKMGGWFCKYFAGMGFEVTGHDSENKVTGRGITVSDSLVGSILNTDQPNTPNTCLLYTSPSPRD